MLQEVETGLSFYSKQRKKPIDVFLNMATSNRICLIAVDGRGSLVCDLGIMQVNYACLETLVILSKS